MVIVLILAASLLIECMVFLGLCFMTARSHLVGELQKLADVVGMNSADAIVFMDPEAARKSLSTLSVDSRVRAAWIIDMEGRHFCEYRRTRSEPVPEEKYEAPGVYRDGGRLIVSRPVLFGEERVGAVVFSAEFGSAYDSLRQNGIIAALVMLVLLVVAYGLSARLARVISLPILDLTETAVRAFSNCDFSIRAKRESDDELGRLTDSFNKLLDQIEEREVALQQVAEDLEDRVQERTDDLEQEVQIRAKTESDLRVTLADKDSLLKEVHHRVKNNLQVISSLFNLQASHVEDVQVREVLTASQNRLRSIALVHEMFYQSDELARIDLAQYLASATSYFLSVHGADPKTIHLHLDCAPMRVAIDTAIPLGLIVHELTSNALKHAFPEQRRGELRVELRPNGNVVQLIVADDGIGIPSHVQWDRSKTLGLQLVHSLTQQIKGQIELDTKNGSCFIVSVPDRLFDPGE